MTAWTCLEPGCGAHGTTTKTATDHITATRHGVTQSHGNTAAAIAARAGDRRRG